MFAECEGCLNKDRCNPYEIRSFHCHLCPCQKCIVKVVCQDPCEPYDDFMNSVYADKLFTDAFDKYKGIPEGLGYFIKPPKKENE